MSDADKLMKKVLAAAELSCAVGQVSRAAVLDHRARVAKANELLESANSTVSPGSGIRTQADARSASAAALANLPPLVIPVDDVGQIL